MFELKEWKIVQYPTGAIVKGNVYNNPKFREGEYIYTSPIQSIAKISEEEMVIKTRNSEYLVKEYEADTLWVIFTENYWKDMEDFTNE